MTTPVIETTSNIVFENAKWGGNLNRATAELLHPSIADAENPVAIHVSIPGGGGIAMCHNRPDSGR